jgi:hypothetical protein
LSAGLGADDGRSMVVESIAQTVCRREAALERRAAACVPEVEESVGRAETGWLRWKQTPRGTRVVDGAQRAWPAKKGRLTLGGMRDRRRRSPQLAPRRCTPPRAKGKKTANSDRGGRNGGRDEEMRFPVLISARKRTAEGVA